MIDIIGVILGAISTLLLVYIGVELYRIDKELRVLERLERIRRLKR